MEDEIEDVYELTCNVEASGVTLTSYKYPAKKTAKYYMGVVVTPRLRERGYSYGLSRRVLHEDIGAIHRTGLHDSWTKIGRRAYYLKEQEEEVIKKMRDNIEQTIQSMYTNVNLLRTAWLNRPTRPPEKHEDSIRKVDQGQAADSGVAVSEVPGVDGGNAGGVS